MLRDLNFCRGQTHPRKPVSCKIWRLFPSTAPVWLQGFNVIDYFRTLRAVKCIMPSSLLSWPTTQGRNPESSVLSQIINPTVFCVSYFLPQTPTILLPLQLFSFVFFFFFSPLLYGSSLSYVFSSFFSSLNIPFILVLPKIWFPAQGRINIYFWGSGLRILIFCLHFQIIFPPPYGNPPAPLQYTSLDILSPIPFTAALWKLLPLSLIY